jgi:uncharacterized membrane protein HdeD (DUF308 family)
MLAHILSRFWWMTLLRGAIAVLFGIMLFVWPQISLASLVLLFGAFSFADGVGSVVTAIGGRQEHESWWVLLLAGLAGIGIGVLTFFNPAATALAILFYIAIWAIATGLLQLVAAVRLRKEIEGEFWLGLAGLASIVFGILLVARPGEGALAVLWLVAAYSIAFGAMLILLAFEARSFVKRAKAAVTHA